MAEQALKDTATRQWMDVRMLGDMIKRLLGSAGRFVHWWRQELFTLLPHFARRMLGAEERIVLIDATSKQLEARLWQGGRQQGLGQLMGVHSATSDGSVAERVKAQAAGAEEVILQLPPDQVMQRDITLPLATEDNLREVLGFEIDRLTPFKREMVSYDHVGLARNPLEGTLSVRLYVVQRSKLEALVARLKVLGIQPTAVTVKDPEGGSEMPVLPVVPNFLEGQRRHVRITPMQRLARISTWVMLALLVVAAILPLWNQQRHIRALESALSSVQREVQQSRKLSTELSALADDYHFLVQRRKAAERPLSYLNELSRVLPDDTWLLRLEVDDRHVGLQGESKDGSKVLSLIENSPLFKETRFAAPVVRISSTDTDRFNVQAAFEEAGE